MWRERCAHMEWGCREHERERCAHIWSGDVGNMRGDGDMSRGVCIYLA